MSTTVDQRVVEMRFDNKQFENNIQTSLSSIDKLKKSLNMDGATKGLESVEKASGKINLSGLSNAVETVNAKFSALEVMAITALANITNSAVNAGKSIVSALTIDPIKTGFQEYETQINAVQTILANTSSKGTTLDQVNNALDELNRYSDKTIYNFTEMTRNIGTFTAAGVDLDTSVSAIKGIANLAAVSGSNSQQASTAAVLVLTGGIVDIKAVGSKIMNSGLIQGIKDKLSHLKETVRDLISNAKQVIEDKIDSFKSIGKHLISGFIGGIKDKASDLANSALSAVKGAVNGVKSFLGIHSPSKLFAQFGRYTDEGFINGVKAYAGKVSDATVDMGKGAVGAMSDTLSTIADLVDSDIDSEPTIRPVMDLSNIQNGANQLFSMMKSVDGYSLSGSLDIANRTGSRINEVRSKTTDNSSVLDKISDAVGNFNGGNSFENTFNITGSNPKEIAEEVSNIIQRQVERRDASWA